MLPKRLPLFTLTVALAASVLAAACGSGDAGPRGTATPGAATTKGVPAVTATIASKSTPEDLRAQLAAEPRLAPIFDAVDRADAAALLRLIDYRPTSCGGRGDDGCPPGVPAGTELPKTNTGPDTFFVSAETLRPYFELLLGGEALRLDFVARSRSAPAKYILGFDGVVKGNGFLPLEDPNARLTGVLLTVDSAAAHPVSRIDLLAEFRRADGVGTAAAAAPGEDYVIELITQVN